MDKQIVTLNNSITNPENTFDVNLQEVLGNQRIVNSGNVRTEVTKYVDSPTKFFSFTAVNQELGIDANGWATAIVEVSGTFVGTLNFEASFSDTNWINISGNYVGPSATATATITAIGIVRVPIAGCTRFRVRVSAWTSGTAQVMMKTSTAPYVTSGASIIGTVPVSGTGIGTSDANIVALLGATGAVPTALNSSALVRPAQEPLPIAAPTPVLPTTYPSNFIGRQQQQLYARLRVESGGDQKMPFAQEQNNNRLVTSDEEAFSLFESIDLQLKALNYMFATAFNVNPPSWYTIVDT